MTALPGAKSLVDYWFHSFNPCHTCGDLLLEYQGQVVAALSAQDYLCQPVSWLGGDVAFTFIMSLRRMENQRWWFYPSAAAMRESYETDLGLRPPHPQPCAAGA